MLAPEVVGDPAAAERRDERADAPRVVHIGRRSARSEDKVRRSLLALLAILVAGCGDDGSSRPVSPSSRWIISDTLASVAVLQVDGMTGRFEGGVVRQFAQRSASVSDSMPLTFTSQGPTDVGWSLFTYPETGDTVFFGYTIWAGHGDRVIPPELISPRSFAPAAGPVSKPQSLTYYPAYIGTHPDLRPQADSAWAAARRLDVAEEFARRPYHVGVLFYPRSVGGFSPDAADWIVFLYAARRQP